MMADVDAAPFAKYPEILQGMGIDLARALMARGIAAEIATQVAVEVTVKFQADWGGLKVYFPSGRTRRREERDREIAANWNGRNTTELCRKHGISESRLRALVAKLKGT